MTGRSWKPSLLISGFEGEAIDASAARIKIAKIRIKLTQIEGPGADPLALPAEGVPAIGRDLMGLFNNSNR
jgi:hypothetical protein